MRASVRTTPCGWLTGSNSQCVADFDQFSKRRSVDFPQTVEQCLFTPSLSVVINFRGTKAVENSEKREAEHTRQHLLVQLGDRVWRWLWLLEETIQWQPWDRSKNLWKPGHFFPAQGTIFLFFLFSLAKVILGISDAWKQMAEFKWKLSLFQLCGVARIREVFVPLSGAPPCLYVCTNSETGDSKVTGTSPPSP